MKKLGIKRFYNLEINPFLPGQQANGSVENDHGKLDSEGRKRGQL